MRVAAGLAPAPAKPIMTFGAVCRASMRAVMRNYLSSLPGLSESTGLRPHAASVKIDRPIFALASGLKQLAKRLVALLVASRAAEFAKP